MSGSDLQALRVAKQLSQETLAEILSVSVRHLSFIENGKTTPSHDLVLRIAAALNVDIQTRNSLLRSWSYATPVVPVDIPQLSTQLKKAIERALSTPLPALAVSSTGHIITFNPPAKALLSMLFGESLPANLNLYMMLLMPEVKQVADNWEELACDVAAHIHNELSLLEKDSDAAIILQEQLALIDAHIPSRTPMLDTNKALPEFEFKLTIQGKAMHLISMPTTLGVPYDDTGQGIRIETFYPQ